MAVILGTYFIIIANRTQSNFIVGGVLMRHVYDAAATSIAIYNEVYVPLVSSKAFVSWWKETFTLIIPLGFLLSYIINKAVQDRADKYAIFVDLLL